MAVNFNEISLEKLYELKKEKNIEVSLIQRAIDKKTKEKYNIEDKIDAVTSVYGIKVGSKFKTETIGSGEVIKIHYLEHKRTVGITFKENGHTKKEQFAPFEGFKFNEIAKGLIK